MFMEEIARIRKDLGISQTAFAELLGVSQAKVSRWEAGVSTPSKAEMIAARTLRRPKRPYRRKSEPSAHPSQGAA